MSDPLDELREYYINFLPQDLDTRAGEPDEVGFAIDRLARRYLRYSFAVSQAMTDAQLDWGLERRDTLMARLSQCSLVERFGRKRQPDEAVYARAIQLIHPDRFAWAPNERGRWRGLGYRTTA